MKRSIVRPLARAMKAGSGDGRGSSMMSKFIAAAAFSTVAISWSVNGVRFMRSVATPGASTRPPTDRPVAMTMRCARESAIPACRSVSVAIATTRYISAGIGRRYHRETERTPVSVNREKNRRQASLV